MKLFGNLLSNEEIFLIAGSYDQVVSISKLNLQEDSLKIKTNKVFINLAELNGIYGYYNNISDRIAIYAVGQGLEILDCSI